MTCSLSDTEVMSQAKLSVEGPGFIGIRFCQECNNMLYPKEDKVCIQYMECFMSYQKL